MPPDFGELEPYIAKAIAKISEFGGDPVIVVNSDADISKNQQALDFDRNRVWRILVGGTKLSRGFTVEGLTITYFRRATNMSDSLTQMGRWFGFRHGYRDLVRLYIAKNSKFGRRTIDLYEAFEGIAIDEAAFRKQLQKYARWEDGAPMVTPAQIPPLVQQHLPWLAPTARNKMFNAVLVREVRQPFTPSGLGAGVDNNLVNLEAWRPILALADHKIELPEDFQPSQPGLRSFSAFAGVVGVDVFLEVIGGLEYASGRDVETHKPVFEFYREIVDLGLWTEVVVIVPQPNTETMRVSEVGDRALIRRRRRRLDRFGEITEPKHRGVVSEFVGGNPADALQQYHSATSGAALIYLVNETEESSLDDESKLVVGYSMYVPRSALSIVPEAPKFSVRRADLPDDITVEASS